MFDVPLWPLFLKLLLASTTVCLPLVVSLDPTNVNTTTSANIANNNGPDKQRVEILVPNGPIVGEKYLVHSVHGGRNMIRFRGIPYAQPPIGKRRFRRPIPVGKNVEPIQALNWPPNCIQTILGDIGVFLSQDFSEDCLYLNVWSPDVNVDEEHLRPVIVYVYDGGLIMGSSSMDLYDSETLAAMADSVVVTFNYRLSTLGFIYSTEVDDVKGNQGLWDQVLALRWVNGNIRYFGGNPKQITLMGHSAGSWSVSAHILSPVSRNLFQNAVLLSGAVSNLNVHQPSRISSLLLHGIRQIDCAADQDTTISSKVIECLEEIDTDKLLEAMFLAKDNAFLDSPDLMVADGEFFPQLPSEAFAASNHKKDFNILVSTVEDEGSTILAMIPNHTVFSPHHPDQITLEEAKDRLSDILVNQLDRQQIDIDTVDRVYFAGFNDNFDNQNLFRKQIGIAIGDSLISCPTLEFVKNIFRNSPNTVQVYQLYHTAKIGNEKLRCSEWMGSCHGLELYPLFGIPFRRPSRFHNRERQISQEMIDILRSFIRTGKPDETQPEWQPYFMANNGSDLVAPYYEIDNNMKSFKNFRFNLKQTECELIWNRYLSRH